MKCPECGHDLDGEFIRCGSCGNQSLTWGEIKSRENYEFLLTWLEENASSLGSKTFLRLRDAAKCEFDSLQESMSAKPRMDSEEVISGKPPQEPLTQDEIEYLRGIEAALGLLPGWVQRGWLKLYFSNVVHDFLVQLIKEIRERHTDPQVTVEAMDEDSVIDFIVQQLPAWRKSPQIKTHVWRALSDALESARNALSSTPVRVVDQAAQVIAAPVKESKVLPEPASRPEYRIPKIDWAKWWQKTWQLVVSGRLLRGLLYLGAFMIVVSTAVLVISFWDTFPQLIQLLFIYSVPSIFYLAGWQLRTRLKLPVAGGVLTGVGSLLLAVDFAAVYQFGGLAEYVDVTTYWLLSSLFCTLIYIFTALRLRAEFFGYIMLVGGISTLLSFTQLLRLPLEWQIAVLALSGPLMVRTAAGLNSRGVEWQELGLALKRTAQLVLLACVVLVLFVPGRSMFGQMITYLFATIGFGLLAWEFPDEIYAHGAVWTSVGAFVSFLRLVELPNEWYATASGILAIFFIITRQTASRKWKQETDSGKNILLALRHAQWVLVGFAAIAGFASLLIDRWAAVAALSLVSCLLGWNAYLDQRPILVLFGGGLFIVPFSLGLDQIFRDYQVMQAAAWLMVAWVGLALAYMGLATTLRNAARYVAGLNQCAHGLAPAALLGLAVHYVIHFDSWRNGPTLVALGGMIVFYIASAILHERRSLFGVSQYLEGLPSWLVTTFFLWPVGMLIPILLCIAWWGSVLKPEWLGTALAGLGLLYVGIGELLRRRNGEYRIPPHALAYPLAISSVFMSSGERWALIFSLYLVVIVAAILALLYRRAGEMFVAALLFILPVYLCLDISPLTTHGYSLVYALLASLGYIPVAILLDKYDKQVALPVHAIGYIIAAFSVMGSMLGRFGFYKLDVPWVGFVTPLIVSGLWLFNALRSREGLFAWAFAVTFPIAFGQSLTLLNVPGIYHSIMWVGLACAYVFIDRWLVYLEGKHTDAGDIFRFPLQVVSIALSGLCLALTIPDTVTAFFASQPERPLLPILAQGLVIGLATFTACLYQKRWPAFVAAGLTFFPITFAWIAYGPELRQAEFAWIWMGMSVLLLGIGFFLDRSEIRYAHGPYFVGYALGSFALIWSMQDRLVFLYTFGIFLIVGAVSQMLVHIGRHHSFDDLLGSIWEKAETELHRVANCAFLIVFCIGFPIWLVELLKYNSVSFAWRGMAVMILAPIYVIGGWLIKRVRDDYAWPFYFVGYALTVLGTVATFDNQGLGITALALDAFVYAVSAYIFRRVFWLYLSTTLLPIVALLTLEYQQKFTDAWIAGVFMGMAFVYVITGWLLDRKLRMEQERVSPFALPFFVVGYGLSAIALLVASAEKQLAIGVNISGVVLYALSALLFRESRFIYPAVWLAAVAYHLGLTLTSLHPDWYGLGWLPLIIAYIVLGRYVFQRAGLGIIDLRSFITSFKRACMPFYLLAYVLSVYMLVISYGNPAPLTITLLVAAAIYSLSAVIFRKFFWLYPGILVIHLAVIPVLSLLPDWVPPHYITLPLTCLMWVAALSGLWLQRKTKRVQRQRIIDDLLAPSWGQPFFLWTIYDLVVWQLLALQGIDTTIIIAISNATLLAMFAMLWNERILACGSLAYLLLAAGFRFAWTGMPLASALAWLAGIGYGIYLFAVILDMVDKARWQNKRKFTIWIDPLIALAISLPTLALAVFGVVFPDSSERLAAVVTLIFAGATYLSHAYWTRNIRLSYLGVAMLEIAWALVLFDQGIAQLQSYAIPAGLYFALVGHLERRNKQARLGTIVEAFGFAVILISSFTQSLNGAEGFAYFLLLLLEGLLVIWWGAANRRKEPFLMGLGVIVLNIVAQVIVLIHVYDVQRWIITLGLGVVLVSVAVIIERSREQIIAQSQEWLKILESWE